MNRFTDEQLNAFDSNIHISVNANAGSGKTSVLIERYLRLVLNEFANGNRNINSVVAITFTKLAAQEMRSRIIIKIEKLIDEFNDDIKREYNTNLHDLKIICEKMSVAPVMTIHSFCYSLLREFPIEADISPNYSELDEYEAFLYKKSAIDEVIENIYAEPDNYPKEFELIARYGMNSINDNVVLMLNSKEKFREVKQLYMRENSLLVEDLNDFFSSALAKFFSGLKDFTSSLDYDYYKIKPEAEDVVNVALLRIVGGELQLSDYVEIYDKLASIKLSRSNFFTKYMAFLVDFFPEIDTKLISEFRKEYYENWDLNGKYFNDVRTLINISEIALEALMNKQHDEAKYDFDDSMLFTLDLLQRNAFDARKKIASRIKYLMVDEFQDTNALQYEIIKHILEIDESVLPQNKLFIVGDPKQSIYGFRSADVKVFGTATEDIVKLNSELTKEVCDERDKIGKQNLTVTFRLRPVLTAFNNIIFSSLMGDEGHLKSSEYEVTYSPFVAGRMVEELKQSVIESETLGNHFGSVHCLVAIDENDDTNPIVDDLTNVLGNESDAQNKEEDLVVNFILKIVNGETDLTVLDEETGERLPCLGDIAILCRKKKSIQKIANALMQHNLPYVISSGRGFYDAQEVIDVMSFLTFINNPADDLALASILRSPMFGIADSTILRISRLNQLDTLYEKMEHFVSNSDLNSNERTRRAYGIINSFLEISVELPLPRLINKIISETAYIGSWSGQPAIQQIKANLQQLIKFSIAFERRGFSMLHDFIKQFEILSEISGEKEASFNTSANAVKLMTCHASKGLEFPIVFLYNMNERAGKNSILDTNKDCGVKMSFKHVAKDSNIPLKTSIPAQLYVKQKNKQAETAELKRLLYVACTRAKDHLILSTELKLNKDGMASLKEFSELLRDANQVFNPASLIAMQRLNVPVEIRTLSSRLSIYSDGRVQVESVPFKFNINFHFQGDTPETRTYKYLNLGNDEQIKLLLGQFIPDSLEQVNFISASKYALFRNDKKAFLDRYILGLSDSHYNGNAVLELNDTKDDTPGTQFGLIVHHVFEHLKLWVEQDGSVNKSFLQKQCIDSSEKFGITKSEIIAQVLKIILKVASTKFFRNHAANLLNSEQEIVLNMPFRNSSLVGILDLLFERNSDQIEIWDWKSNAITNEQIEEVALSYIPQLEFYSYLIWRRYKNVKSITCRLIFTNLATDDNDDWCFTHIIDSSEFSNLNNKIETDFDEILLL
ncbi:MAG: UvrD-helicase domain-containing protein [Candidatus Kapabacteria bacterium]|nr:UvrD-helicase domain-containing protein [Candidatus Kapabacteria bacterium]